MTSLSPIPPTPSVSELLHNLERRKKRLYRKIFAYAELGRACDKRYEKAKGDELVQTAASVERAIARLSESRGAGRN